MPPIFKDAFHDGFGAWPLGYIPYGGADLGEVLAVAEVVGNGNDSAFYDAWMAAGDRLAAEAAESIGQRRDGAREILLRASAFYGTAYHPIYGKPVDGRLLAAFRKQMAAFDQGMALRDAPVRPIRIPFEDTSLPAYLIPASGRPAVVRPLLILTNGYDATITDMYFASAVAASRRGYHCLLFDGPGQGEMLYEHGVPLRADWETVIRAVVDVAEKLPIVDPRRIALSGWSLGGYFAPRAASGEQRLAACIADPGQPCVADGFRRAAIRLLGATPESVADLGEAEPDLLDRLWQFIQSDRRLRWSVEQRGFWANGVDNLRDYLRSVETFTMAGRTELIICPTLLTLAESDPLAAGTEALYDSLRCPKTLLRFSASEGAGEHCEMKNRSLLNRRVLDWLDGIFERDW
jgi:alpha-beta hydrolase superfamily lysophospholipase